MSRRYAINPSSCGKFLSGAVHTSKSHVCFRVRYGKFNSMPRSEIPLSLKRIGEFWEDVVGRLLGYDAVKEEWLEQEIGGYNTRGFIDYSFPDLVIECKALGSSARRLKIIRKGIVDEEHLTQTVLYLIAKKLRKGFLMYAYVHLKEEGSDELVIPECTAKGKNRREFQVELRGEDIYVDNEKHELTVESIYQYMIEHDKAMRSEEIPDRPFQLDLWTSPCNRCDFSEACDWYDEQKLIGETPGKHEMLDRMAELVPLEPDTYDLYVPKKRKKKCKDETHSGDVHTKKE